MTELAGETNAAAEGEAVRSEGTLLPEGGVCLITAGAVGAGKSTLQRCIIHRLFTDERLDFQLRNADGEEHHDPRLQEWIFRTDRGEFPARTQGMLETFFIEFGQRKRSVRLSFAEIAGEHFERILPEREGEEEGRIIQEVEDILTSQDVQKLIVLVADARRYSTKQKKGQTGEEDGNGERNREQARYEDMMFAALLAQVRKLGLRKIKLLFVAAKWDEVKPKSLDPERFFRQHFPQTRSVLRRYRKADVQYLRFSVGTVSRNEDGTARAVVRPDPKPAERVVQWIFTQATGRRLKSYPHMKETIWERIMRWAAQ